MIAKQKGKQKKAARLSVSLDHLGFTILEILVALVMGSIFITAICALIIDQTKTHEDHQMKVMMQQDGRAALSILTNELMLAGYSPVPGQNASMTEAGIDQFAFDYFGGATPTSVSYSWHLQGNGDVVLRRNGNYNSFVKNVEAFRVLYGYDLQGSGFDGYGVLEEDGSGNTIWAYSSQNDETLDACYIQNSNGTMTPIPGISISIDRIRAVKIWLLMRSNKKKNKGQAEIGIDFIPGDAITRDPDYSYRLYTTTVKLRNMYY